jgi:hypothetical protein
MKYIRTKNDVCTFEKYWLDNATRKTFHILITNEEAEDIEIINQADTIEELCDELVVHNPSNDGDFYPKHFVYQNKWETMLKPMSDYQKSKGIEIFGAIWTDKGLIYVAKMNEKGELELL